MKSIFKISFIVLSLLISNKFISQTINITDPDQIPINCANFNDGSVVNFVDDGIDANYGANRNDVITICPDLPNGPKIALVFGVTGGALTYDIHPTDTLYVYDGMDENAPLLGAINNGTNPTGASFMSSFENNPSGCLTIKFISDAANDGTGWGANISCGNPVQPFYPHVEAYINGQGLNALNPIDTGYVNLCLGDSILLIAKPLFPYSLENNPTIGGYSQTIDNVSYEWEMSNGWLGENNDSIWFKPQERSGFYLDLKITDAFPQSTAIFCKIRVSQLPIFAPTGPVASPICPNEQAIILGGATPLDTVGISFPPGSFQIGGSVAGLTYLPDGSGLEYSTTINMNDFPDTAVFASASDLQNICMTIEHSYIGDIEIWLSCPNGQEVGLLNGYDQADGHLPNGMGNSISTYLGDPDDLGNLTPGIGWEYCFSSVNNTWGDMATEYNNNNTITSTIDPIGPSMNPDGVYLPEISFDNFIGCPLNGDWTIHVRDNQTVDDGYIFEWGLYFDANLFPDVEYYTNSLVEEHWMNDPTIISNQSDTSITVLPGLPGSYDYTFVVTDDYACVYDTVVTVVVVDFPTVDPVSIPPKCAGETFDAINFTGTPSSVFTWVNSDPSIGLAANGVDDIASFVAVGGVNLTSANIQVTPSIGGCFGPPTSFNLTVYPMAVVNAGSDIQLCDKATTTISATGAVNYAWDNGLGNGPTHSISPSDTTTYTVTGTDGNGCIDTDEIIVNVMASPIVDAGNDTTICMGEPVILTGEGGNAYIWDNNVTDGQEIFPNETTTYSVVGQNDNGCVATDQIEITVLELPSAVILPSITVGTPTLNVEFVNGSSNANSYTWNLGNGFGSYTIDNLNTQTDSYSTIGNYTVTLSASNGVCSNEVSVTISVINFDPPVIEVPNIFTPDADLKNDWYYISTTNTTSLEAKIYNRWGNLVYEMNGLFDKDVPSSFWNGTIGSKEGSEGVYFITYTIVGIDGETYTGQENIQLVRK